MTKPNDSKDDTKIKGVIKHPCIVTFTGEPSSLYLPPNLKLLCCVVAEDLSGMLETGMQFRSSPIKHVSGNMVTTANSLYKVEGEVEYVEVPFKYLQLVLDMVHPRQIETLHKAGLTLIGATWEDF